MSTLEAVLVGIIPSIGVGLIFWFAMRAVIRADRNERAALAREDQAAGARSGDAGGPDDAPTDGAPTDDAPTDDAPAPPRRDTHPS